MKEFLRILWNGMENTSLSIVSIAAIYCGVCLLKQIPDLVGFAVLLKLFISVIFFFIGIVFLGAAGCDK